MVEATPREQRPRGGTELLKPGDTRFATEFIAPERVLNCRLLLPAGADRGLRRSYVVVI
jgi:hypothetical protein